MENNIENKAGHYRSQCDEDGFLGYLLADTEKDVIHELSNRFADEQPEVSCNGAKIPNIIHQIWLGPNPIPDEYKVYMSQWKAQYPDWEYILWDDEKIKTLSLRTGDLINFSNCFGFKSDILRAEILSQFGGVYIDVDYEPIKSIIDIYDSYDFFGTFRALPLLHISASHYYNSPILVCNSFVGSIPGHPILNKYLDRLVDDKNRISLSFGEKYGLARLKYSIEKLTSMKTTLLKSYLPFHTVVMENIIDQDHKNMIYPPTFFNPVDSWAKFQYFIAKYWIKRLEYSLKYRKFRVKKFDSPVAETIAIHHSKATWTK